MRVRDLMTTKLFTIREDKHLLAAEEIMAWAHVRHVPVVDKEGRLVGLLSHRDILGAAVSSLAVKIASAERRQHLAALDVRQIAHRPVTTIGPDETVQAAARRMRADGLGCLPVVEGGQLVGILTTTDMLRLLETSPDGAFVRSRTAADHTTASV